MFSAMERSRVGKRRMEGGVMRRDVWRRGGSDV